MKNAEAFSRVATGSAAISLVSLLSLHVLSAELDPMWHMVSEYAYGEYGWVLSLFFFAWAVSYWATSLALFPLAKHWLAKIGVALIFVSGVGALMGGLFDVRHSLHGLAFGIGVPFIPLVAPLITSYLGRKQQLKSKYATWLSHATWISFILMAVTMGMFISQMLQAGAMNMETPQLLMSLPEGITTVIGYANRFLVVAYLGWLIAVNWLVMKKNR
jgi:hypothetical protein